MPCISFFVFLSFFVNVLWNIFLILRSFVWRVDFFAFFIYITCYDLTVYMPCISFFIFLRFFVNVLWNVFLIFCSFVWRVDFLAFFIYITCYDLTVYMHCISLFVFLRFFVNVLWNVFLIFRSFVWRVDFFAFFIYITCYDFTVYILNCCNSCIDFSCFISWCFRFFHEFINITIGSCDRFWFQLRCVCVVLFSCWTLSFSFDTCFSFDWLPVNICIVYCYITFL